PRSSLRLPPRAGFSPPVGLGAPCSRAPAFRSIGLCQQPLAPAVESNAAGIRVPDELVELELHPDLEPRREEPRGEPDGPDGAEDAAQKDREAPVERVLADDAGRPVEVPPGGDDELDLVGRLEQVEVRPDVVLALAAVWALEVHDHPDARVHAGYGDEPA